MEIYYDALLKAVQNKKRKIEKSDKKYIVHVIVSLLSHIYKPEENLRSICSMCLEKILISFPAFIDANIKNIDDFNKDLLDQLS